MYAERILHLIDRVGVETRADFDRAFLKDASFIKATRRLSLADNTAFVSTDHRELDPVNAAGVCRILFIR
jgi:hypothetical protein